MGEIVNIRRVRAFFFKKCNKFDKNSTILLYISKRYDIIYFELKKFVIWLKNKKYIFGGISKWQ